MLYKKDDMNLNNKIELITLFDYYSGLLTDKQRGALKLYLIEDLGITEIAQNLNITRQATYDLINVATASLRQTEGKLGLIKSNSLAKKELDSILNDSSLTKSQILNKIKSIKEIL